MKTRSARTSSSLVLLCTAVVAGACSGSVDGEAPATRKNEALTAAPSLLGEEPIYYLQRASIASLGDTPVELANGELLRVDETAESVLGGHRELAAQIEGAQAALWQPAVTSEEFVETEDELVFFAETSFVVSDPALLRQLSPRMATVQSRVGTVSLKDMSEEQLGQFHAFRAQVLKKSPSHPLYAPAKQGDQAFLDAVLAGKGDVSFQTRVRVPANRLQRSGLNVLAPSITNGAFDFTHADNRRLGVTASAMTLNSLVPEEDPRYTYEGDEKKSAFQFVNGYLIDDAYEWSESWSFGVGWARLTAGAWYAAGLRVPIKVSGSITPAKIAAVGGDHDVESEFTTEFEVTTLDADEDFYEKAGVPSSATYEGKELVLEGGAFVNVRVYAGWGAIDIDQNIPANNSFDLGQQFTPPFGDCGTSCGFDVWVPSELTHTAIDLGIVKGEARVGVKVTGEGEVGLTYESLYGDDVVTSRKGSGAGRLEQSYTLDDDATKSLTTSLAPLSEFGEKPFGYRISDVDYTWDIDLIPGIRGDVEVNASPFFTIDETIGPFWLDFVRINLGSVHLGRLDGTYASHEMLKGIKSWRETFVDVEATNNQAPGNFDATDLGGPGEPDADPGPTSHQLDLETTCAALSGCDDAEPELQHAPGSSGPERTPPIEDPIGAGPR